MLSIFKPFKRTWNRWQQPPGLHEDGLETIIEYRQRWRSIHIMYFTFFFRLLGINIMSPGVWPYLDKLDPNAGKVFMGYVVAANPLGQMVFEPLFAHWRNKIKSIRLPLIVTIAVFGLFNVLYSCLGVFPSGSVKYVMLITRFLTGVGTANLSICRAYIAEATRETERTGSISISFMASALSLAMGPALQTSVTSLGENGLTIIPGLVVLNMYTATGWINVTLSIINIVLCLPIFFKEKRIAALEVMTREGLATEEATYENSRIDHFAIWALLFGIFVVSINTSAIISISTSMTMDQFAWSHAEALYYMSLAMALCAIVSLLFLFVVPALCRMLSDRNVLIFVGFLALVFGCGLNVPFLDRSTPKMKEPLSLAINATAGVTQYFTINSSDSIELVGCPTSQKWCQTTPALPLTQFLIGFVFTLLGYEVSLTVMQVLYCKVLGCRPQGVWMGLFTISIGVSRIIGPIYSGNIYPLYGMYWTFGSLTLIVFFCMFCLWLLRHRFKAPIRPNANFETNTSDPVTLNTKL